MQFLRALVDSEPIACVLMASAELPAWLVPTWEGLISWAYHAAQRFDVGALDDNGCKVVVPLASAISHYVKPSAVGSEQLGLQDGARRLNLLVLEPTTDAKELARFEARWPGPVFYFSPDFLNGPDAQFSANVVSLVNLLQMVGGHPDLPYAPASTNPLKLLLVVEAVVASSDGGDDSTAARASDDHGRFVPWK